MGQQIAVQIMKHGLNVIVHDISQANLELAKKKIHEFVPGLI
jgi:3-hydroxyacyl-CoA dehydrogenase